MNTESSLAAERKARGAFFTPPEISKFLSDWAVRSRSDQLLEPSCGEAAFLLAAAESLKNAGATNAEVGMQLHGVDVHAESVASAERLLTSEGFTAQLAVGDFFQRKPEPIFDAVVGNPPYVRYQSFSGEFRARALEAALRQGVRLNQLASSWAAFTVHASAFLKPEGRLALVLPAELLAVKYAAQIRRFLLDRFATVRLVLFENLVFPGVLEEVVLLLAEGTGRAESFEVYQARDVRGLASIAPANWIGFTPGSHDKWTGALLSSEAFKLYEQTLERKGFEVMLDWGETYLGAVTGNNDYFTLTRAEANKLKLPQNELLRISPPGSRHLRGLTFSEAGWQTLTADDARCYLFAPSSQPSRAAERYIEHGESLKVHKAYKCSVREPWWRVPLVPRPDLLFAYMNHDRVRLIRNGAGVHLLNSLYGVRLKKKRCDLGQELLALASLNSMTLLGGEIVGRSYGGGLLKHEPKEVDLLPVPSFEVVKRTVARLRAIYPQVGALLRRNDITPALDIVDRIILKDHLNMTDAAVKALREARETLFQRRRTRARGQNGSDR
jgi:adenine-specific DNA-methyltransferase